MCYRFKLVSGLDDADFNAISIGHIKDAGLDICSHNVTDHYATSIQLLPTYNSLSRCICTVIPEGTISTFRITRMSFRAIIKVRTARPLVAYVLVINDRCTGQGTIDCYL